MSLIAFIGLGAMGLPMARRLLDAGHEVAGFDLRRDAVERLEEAGGRACESAVDAARGADILMLMVVSVAQAHAVLFEGGALAALREGGTVVLTATCPPREVELIAGAVEAAGRHFADAPVSGGTVGAEGGTLSVMLAARSEVFSALQPALGAIGRLFYVGEKPGQGAAIKVINQLLCGVHIAAAAEALALAQSAGVDPALALEILRGSAAASWMLNDRGPRMLQDTPEVSSAIDIFVKDLGLVLDAGRDFKAALPLAATAHQFFISTSSRGGGSLDDSQIIQAYQLLNGKR